MNNQVNNPISSPINNPDYEQQKSNSSFDIDNLAKQVSNMKLPLVEQLESPRDRAQGYLDILDDAWSDEIAYKAFEEIKKIPIPKDKYFTLQALSQAISFHRKGL
ncbi:MAG: hypothetical protein ACOX0Z_01100 [Candidatus Nanosyncoccaceae bacterium]|jgi:hypothetical protein